MVNTKERFVNLLYLFVLNHQIHLIIEDYRLTTSVVPVVNRFLSFGNKCKHTSCNIPETPNQIISRNFSFRTKDVYV